MVVARHSAVITVMTRAAEKAAKSLVRDFGEVENLQVSRKGPSDFVSMADKRSEKIIVEELLKARPTFGVLGEEGSNIAGEDKDHRWIIDPLDGTFNFLHGIPHWSITIALEKKGEIVAGLVHDPIKHEMFWAEKGVGAYMNARRLRVSSRHKPEEAMIVVGTPSAGMGDHARFITEIEPVINHFGGVRSFGGAALDLAYVAAGRSDAFWEHHTAAWDVSAGILMVREAGGIVTEPKNSYTPPYNRGVIAGNTAIHPMLADILAKNAGPAKTGKTARS